MKCDTVKLIVTSSGGDRDVTTARIPRYKSEDWIKSLFVQLLGIKYDERYCSYEIMKG